MCKKTSKEDGRKKKNKEETRCKEGIRKLRKRYARETREATEEKRIRRRGKVTNGFSEKQTDAEDDR